MTFQTRSEAPVHQSQPKSAGAARRPGYPIQHSVCVFHRHPSSRTLREHRD